jgi:hypothetical protein
MTKRLKILDALPGCGKTTAIFKYMVQQTERPWLYLSPMKKEINDRVPHEAEANGTKFFVATEEKSTRENKTKTHQVLLALQQGENVACTHALMLRFTAEHLKAIKDNNYNIVCDEELDLIRGYNALNKGDVQFLIENKVISINEEDGKIELIGNIPEDARYSDVALYAGMGCLYAAKTRNDFLVIQMSPKLIDAANDFILLSYMYEGSIMQTFMSMHGYSHEKLDVQLMYSEQERIAQLRELVQFVETPSVKKIQKQYRLSASWWENAKEEDIEVLEKCLMSVIKKEKVSTDKIMHTLPKLNHTGSSEGKSTRKIFKPRHYDTEISFVQSTARATNEYKHKELAVHMLDVYPNQPVVAYMQDMLFVCDRDRHALATLVQWLFRGCIREGKPMKVALLSSRMSILFKSWLSKIRS